MKYELVIIDENGSVVKSYDDNVTVEKVDKHFKEHIRLIQVENEFKKHKQHYLNVTLHNEAMLKIITENLIRRGFFKGRELDIYKIIKPTTDEIIDEYEIKKALGNRFKRVVRQRVNRFWISAFSLPMMYLKRWFWNFLKKNFKIDTTKWES